MMYSSVLCIQHHKLSIIPIDIKVGENVSNQCFNQS